METEQFIQGTARNRVKIELGTPSKGGKLEVELDLDQNKDDRDRRFQEAMRYFKEGLEGYLKATKGEL